MSTKVATHENSIPQSTSSARLHWKLEVQEYALLLVIAFIFWTFGFIELLNHTSAKPTILGLYSTGFFVSLLIYSSGFLVLGGLLARPKHSGWLTRSVTIIQSNWVLASLTLVICSLLIWGLIALEPLSSVGALRQLANLPVVRFTLASLIAIFGGLIIFAGWGQQHPVSMWRKALALIIGLIVGLEVLVQGLAYYGALPGNQVLNGSFVPFGRIYQNQEGFSNSTTNNYGWHYPNVELRKDTRKILIIGDSFIQAIQVDPTQHLGVQLEAHLNAQQDQAVETEVLAMGMPGFGPGLYLSESRLTHAIDVFDPDEIIIFFHLSNDFQLATEPSTNHLIHTVDEAGYATLHPDSNQHIHNLKHHIESGYIASIDPIKTIGSHILMPKLIQQFISAGAPANMTAGSAFDVPRIEGVITNQTIISPKFANVKETSLISTPGTANFLFEKNPSEQAQDAVEVAAGIFKVTHDYLSVNDITLRIVTIPAFPPAFYTQSSAEAWSPEIGDYDLFQPERALQSLVEENSISFLPMGQYMHKNTTSVAEIQELFFLDGLGHFTPQGHAYFANALQDCFYDQATLGADAPHCLDN